MSDFCVRKGSADIASEPRNGFGSRSRRIGVASTLVVAAIVFAYPVPASVPGVKVALLPASLVVAPGDSFDLTLQVTRAGSAFNAFDAYIGFDPSALTLIQRTPVSLQEGAYFTAACGNRFHRFQAGVDRDTITDVLLCANTSLTGPGAIYKLRFRASNLPRATVVRFLPGLQFYNAGTNVNPDSSSNAVIGIGVAAGVPAPVTAPALKLTIAPNPAHGRTSFIVESDRAGEQRLLVVDLLGRVVRNLDNDVVPAGTRTVAWDGRNDSGLVVPPGRYSAMLRVPGRTFQKTFTILK